MISVKPKIHQKLEVDIVADDGRDINHILEEIVSKMKVGEEYILRA